MGQGISRGADSQQKTVEFGWSREDRRQMGKKSRELAEILGSHLCSVSATSSERVSDAHLFGFEGLQLDELPLLSPNPSITCLREEDWLG